MIKFVEVLEDFEVDDVIIPKGFHEIDREINHCSIFVEGNHYDGHAVQIDTDEEGPWFIPLDSRWTVRLREKKPDLQLELAF